MDEFLEGAKTHYDGIDETTNLLTPAIREIMFSNPQDKSLRRHHEMLVHPDFAMGLAKLRGTFTSGPVAAAAHTQLSQAPDLGSQPGSLTAPVPAKPGVVPPLGTDTLTDQEKAENKAFWDIVRETKGQIDLDEVFTPALREIVTDKSVDKAVTQRRFVRHTDFSGALARIRNIKAVLDLPPEQRRAGFTPLLPQYLAEWEQEYFGDPNKRLYLEDRRPQIGTAEIPSLPVWATYSRVAGTMDEKEQFIFLVVTAVDFLELAPGSDGVEPRLCALYGDGKGRREWEVDPNYNGDRGQEWLKKAEELYTPPKVSEYFENFAEFVFGLQKQNPDHPLVVWGLARLRPHSAGWATSR